jgi:hypothetical protein
VSTALSSKLLALLLESLSANQKLALFFLDLSKVRLCQSTLQNNLFPILHQPNSIMALTWQAKGNFAVQLRSVISACHMLVAIFR